MWREERQWREGDTYGEEVCTKEDNVGGL